MKFGTEDKRPFHIFCPVFFVPYANFFFFFFFFLFKKHEAKILDIFVDLLVILWVLFSRSITVYICEFIKLKVNDIDINAPFTLIKHKLSSPFFF